MRARNALDSPQCPSMRRHASADYKWDVGWTKDRRADRAELDANEGMEFGRPPSGVPEGIRRRDATRQEAQEWSRAIEDEWASTQRDMERERQSAVAREALADELSVALDPDHPSKSNWAAWRTPEGQLREGLSLLRGGAELGLHGADIASEVVTFGKADWDPMRVPGPRGMLYDTGVEVFTLGQAQTPFYDPGAGVLRAQELREQGYDTGTIQDFVQTHREDQPTLGETSAQFIASQTPGHDALMAAREGRWLAAGGNLAFDVGSTFWVPGRLAKAARSGASAGDLTRMAAAGVYSIGAPGDPMRAARTIKNEARVAGTLIADPQAIPLSTIEGKYTTYRVPTSELKNVGGLETRQGMTKTREAFAKGQAYGGPEGVEFSILPEPSSSVMVYRDADDSVLLTQRAYGQHYGQWASPGGVIDPGETAQKAAVREAFEETGVHGRVVGDLEYSAGPMHASTLMEYTHGTVRPGGAGSHGELLDRRWVPREEVQDYDLAFPDAELANIDRLNVYRETGELPPADIVPYTGGARPTFAMKPPRHGFTDTVFHASPGEGLAKPSATVHSGGASIGDGLFASPGGVHGRFVDASAKGHTPLLESPNIHMINIRTNPAEDTGLVYKRNLEDELLFEPGTVLDQQVLAKTAVTSPMDIRFERMKAQQTLGAPPVKDYISPSVNIWGPEGAITQGDILRAKARGPVESARDIAAGFTGDPTGRFKGYKLKGKKAAGSDGDLPDGDSASIAETQRRAQVRSDIRAAEDVGTVRLGVRSATSIERADTPHPAPGQRRPEARPVRRQNADCQRICRLCGDPEAARRGHGSLPPAPEGRTTRRVCTDRHPSTGATARHYDRATAWYYD